MTAVRDRLAKRLPSALKRIGEPVVLVGARQVETNARLGNQYNQVELAQFSVEGNSPVFVLDSNDVERSGLVQGHVIVLKATGARYVTREPQPSGNGSTRVRCTEE